VWSACCIFSAATVAGCYSFGHYGKYYWTAGQRVDLTSESEFVWRVGMQVYPMTFHKWHGGQPDYYQQSEYCMNIFEDGFYSWNDVHCTIEVCAVCEIER